MRIVDWASDSRSRLGMESHRLVCEEYARFGYPDQELALDVPELRREYQSALGRLLSRVLIHTSESDERRFDPHYTGSDEETIALQLDVSGTATDGVVGIATHPGHWARVTDSVAVAPSPPAVLALCFQPGGELPEERLERVRVAFAGKRLHIVGGQVDDHVVAAIVDETGVLAGDVTWTPCERARPPRNLDQRWRGLDRDRDITVCITGRVGHATSDKAKVAATRAGVVHLKVESAQGIIDALKAHAQQASS